jgi:ketosteroid isomerase-like protein
MMIEILFTNTDSGNAVRIAYMYLVLSSVFIANNSLAQQPPANLPAPRAALWREIRAVNDSMETAFKRGDMKAVSHFYADDAKMTGGGPVVEGRAALDAYWARLASSPGTWKLEIFEIGGSRDLAYQKGRSTLTQRDPAGGADRVSVVNFVVIWKRAAGGGLRIAMDLY